MYRSSPHSITKKSPAEMMYGRVIRDKLPTMHQPLDTDEETRDTDRENKAKGKIYADKHRNAKPNDVKVGDIVLVKRQVVNNKLDSPFETTEYEVIKRSGSEVTVTSLATGSCYRRNVSHVKKIPAHQNLPSISSSPSMKKKLLFPFI